MYGWAGSFDELFALCGKLFALYVMLQFVEPAPFR